METDRYIYKKRYLFHPDSPMTKPATAFNFSPLMTQTSSSHQVNKTTSETIKNKANCQFHQPKPLPPYHLPRNCFEFLQKVLPGLMFPFSCALWAIFWPFSFLFFVRQPAIFLITGAKITQKLIPNHRTINSKQFLRSLQKKYFFIQKLKSVVCIEYFL